VAGGKGGNVIELRMMAAGLAALGAAFNREVTPQIADVYHGVIGPKLTEAQWQRAVRRALEAETFFPPPSALLRYGQADGAPQARAAEVYDRLVSHYERGDNLGPREVLEKYGDAAMEAFVAAGGTRAFSWCEPSGEPFRRKAFIEAWIDVTDQDPLRALPSGERPRLN
jgi:hypothetical protein